MEKTCPLKPLLLLPHNDGANCWETILMSETFWNGEEQDKNIPHDIELWDSCLDKVNSPWNRAPTQLFLPCPRSGLRVDKQKWNGNLCTSGMGTCV